jgi:molecular chaperone DnaK (HSP70)
MLHTTHVCYVRCHRPFVTSFTLLRAHARVSTTTRAGDAAKNQAAINPEGTVFDVKRLIGRAFTDKTVQADMKHWPFKVVNRNGKPNIQVNEHQTIACSTLCATLFCV